MQGYSFIVYNFSFWRRLLFRTTMNRNLVLERSLRFTFLHNIDPIICCSWWNGTLCIGSIHNSPSCYCQIIDLINSSLRCLHESFHN